MADFPRPTGIIEQRAVYENIRWNRSRRPRTGGVPCPTWSFPGLIDVDVQPTPLRVSIDPRGHDQLIEYKALVGFDGWLSLGGPLLIEWYVDDILVAENHSISGFENEIMLDDPIVMKTGKHWIRPAFGDPPDSSATGLSMVAIIEVISV